MRRKVGQGMTEYICIGSLVLIVCAAGFKPLAEALSNIFSGMVPKAPTQASLIASSSPGSSTDDGKSGNSPSDTLNSPTSGDNPAAFSSYPSDMKNIIQTTGGNGATQMMADLIRQVGEHLLAKGELNEDQANAFFALANQGNYIANIEKLVEDAYKNGQTSITFEGKSYTPFELSRKVGWIDDPTGTYPFNVNNPDINEAINRAVDYRSDSLQSFFSLYQTLQNSGALSNPEVQQTIGALTTRIAYLSEVTEYSVAAVSKGESPSTLQNNYISDTTYWNSKDICSTGNGETTGVTCQ